MSEILRSDYYPHPGQMLYHQSPARFRVLNCGARWGKDRATGNDLIARCLGMSHEPHRQGLIPKVLAWYVAPTYPLSTQMWEELAHFTAPLEPELNHSDRKLELPGGIVIEVKSAHNPDALVARGVDYVAVTEAALLDEAAWERSLRPRLASPGRGPGGLGGIATLNSTPRGRNWFWRAFLRGQDPLEPTWQSWSFPTQTNPHIRPEEIEAARREMPDRWFRQEFLAEFLDDGGGVFKGVRKLLQAVEPSAGPGSHVIGIDWGRVNDYTCVLVLDTACSPWRVEACERWSGLPYDTQLERVKAICDLYKPVRVVPESNSIGDPLVEQLNRDLPWSVQPFVTTGTSKRQVIESLALSVEQGGLVIPAEESSLRDVDGQPILKPVSWAEQLVIELEAYEYTTTRAGNITYSAPSGLHDDTVMALALANNGAGAGQCRIEVCGPSAAIYPHSNHNRILGRGPSVADYNRIYRR